jgi:hypothetical protein
MSDFIKIRPVGARVVPCRLTYTRKDRDMRKIISVFANATIINQLMSSRNKISIFFSEKHKKLCMDIMQYL